MGRNPLLKNRAKKGNNSSGNNGSDNGTCQLYLSSYHSNLTIYLGPEEEDLKASLEDYARRKMRAADRVQALVDDHNLTIAWVGLM